MLHFDLAGIYEYTASRSNEQVSTSLHDFCFHLTKDEFQILMSGKLISRWEDEEHFQGNFLPA